MGDLSYFESRTGKVTSSAEDVYNFVSDVRNFERFIPDGTITNWNADRDACSFSVAMLGTVTVRVTGKEKFSKVVYEGDALKKNDFEITLNISDNGNNSSDVNVSLNADLNPMLKMMAAKPIAQFLEMLIIEMEKFSNWRDIRV